MNNVITPNNRLTPLVPAVEAIVLARGGTLGDRYELEDTIIRAGGFAWDIGAEAAPLHAQITAITQAEADDEAFRIANPPAPSPEMIWLEKLNSNITDAPTGIVISANEATRNLVTGQLLMVTTAINLGQISGSTPQDIWDKNGLKHTMPASELIGLIFRYGVAWSAIHEEFAP